MTSNSHTASDSDCNQVRINKFEQATVNCLHKFCSRQFSSSVEGIEVVIVSSSGEQCCVILMMIDCRVVEVDEEIPNIIFIQSFSALMLCQHVT